MSATDARITETEMAEVIKAILAKRPNKAATYAELRELVPEHAKLSKADRIESPTRPGEELWFQIVRNLISHKHEDFVQVKGGLRLQWRKKSAAVAA